MPDWVVVRFKLLVIVKQLKYCREEFFLRRRGRSEVWCELPAWPIGELIYSSFRRRRRREVWCELRAWLMGGQSGGVNCQIGGG